MANGNWIEAYHHARKLRPEIVESSVKAKFGFSDSEAQFLASLIPYGIQTSLELSPAELNHPVEYWLISRLEIGRWNVEQAQAAHGLRRERGGVRLTFLGEIMDRLWHGVRNGGRNPVAAKNALAIAMPLVSPADKFVKEINGFEMELSRRLSFQRLAKIKEDVKKSLNNLWIPTKPEDWKEFLFTLQNGVCNGCFGRVSHPHMLEVDHIRPRKRGGGDEVINLQLLCPNCNRIKGDKRMWDLTSKRKEDGMRKSANWQRPLALLPGEKTGGRGEYTEIRVRKA